MKKKFKAKALQMLIAAITIIENFIANQAALIEEQPQWANPFITSFRTRVQTFLQTYFGISSKAQVKEATRVVVAMMDQGVNELSMIKTQIMRNFSDNLIRRDTLLDLLGYKLHWKKANHNNQTELISLLYTFANNLTPEIRTELEGKNVNAARITTVLGLKQTLSDANITQETLKGSSKLDTVEAITELNKIYDEAMDICEIGKKLFRAEPARRDLFVFSKIVRAQGIPPSGETGEAPA